MAADGLGAELLAMGMAADVNVIGCIGSSGGSNIGYPFLAALGRAVWSELNSR